MIRRDFLSLGLATLATSTLPAGAASATVAPLALPPLRTMHARKADSVCEAYMVNTKLFYKDTVYGYTDAVVDLLKDLGVRIVRERLTTGTSIGTRKQQQAMVALAKAGTRWHATVGSLEEWRDAKAFHRKNMNYLTSYYKPRVGGDLSRLMHSFGGCNEIDGPTYFGHEDPEWALHARIMQRALWAAAKENPATRHIPVAGPSTRTDVTRTRAALLGDLSGMCDVGNAHMYNKGTSPTQDLDEHINILRPCFPRVNRWIFAETGYNDSPQTNLGNTIPPEATATYVIRGICDHFRRRSVYGRFELLDEPDAIDYSTQTRINRTAAREAHFGLVAMTKNNVRAPSPDTWRKKPEFYATKRFLALMSDRGPNFTPRSLDVAISGGGRDLQKALVQKRNGKHYLLLWRDVQVSTLYPNAHPITIRPDDITVRLRTERPIAVYSPRWGEAPVATYAARSSFTVPVRGDLIVVRMG